MSIKDSLLSKMVDVQPVVQGILEQTVPMRAVLVRTEQAINAPAGGRLKRVVQEGERVRKGALVAYVLAGTADTSSGSQELPIYTAETGIVSYRVDGLEGLLTPDNITKLGAAKLAAAVESEKPVSSGGAGANSGGTANGALVERGQLILKVINNLKPTYLLVNRAQNNIRPELVAAGGKINGRLQNGQGPEISQPIDPMLPEQDEDTISFRSVSENNSGGSQYLVLNTNSFQQEFLQQRVVNLALIANRYHGYLVPKSAIVNKNGTKGIYIVYKEVVDFQVVAVDGEVGDQAAVQPAPGSVTSLLTANALVVKNPSLVTEGQPVYVR